MSLWFCAEHSLFGGGMTCPTCQKVGTLARLESQVEVKCDRMFPEEGHCAVCDEWYACSKAMENVAGPARPLLDDASLEVVRSALAKAHGTETEI